MTPELAAALTRALFCGLLFREKRMCLVVGFSDESATGDSLGPFLQAGYIAPSTSWPSVAEAWAERVLCREPRIPYLHMREIRNPEWMATYGLSHLQAADKVEEAAKVIHAAGDLVPIVSIIQRADLEGVIKGACRRSGIRIPTGLDQPDYLSFVAYADIALSLLAENFPGTLKLDLVVSRKQTVTHHIKRFYQAMKDSPGYPLAHLVGDLIPASMEERNPLQAADALAWHERRFIEKGTRDPNYFRFLKSTTYVREWKKPELEEFVSGLLARASAQDCEMP
jgi:hypothetical protein